jgi:hypothetical protein
MAMNPTEVAEIKGSQATVRPARAPKEAGPSTPPVPTARFFLAKLGASGSAPTLDHECATEAEAMAEAFKAGASYYAVTEYRAIVDCSGKQPQFKKEVVTKNR